MVESLARPRTTEKRRKKKKAHSDEHYQRQWEKFWRERVKETEEGVILVNDHRGEWRTAEVLPYFVNFRAQIGYTDELTGKKYRIPAPTAMHKRTLEAIKQRQTVESAWGSGHQTVEQPHTRRQIRPPVS